MRVLLLLLLSLSLSLSLFRVVDAVKCGTALTTACLGATDVRYDKDASNDALDQARVWSKMSGLFRGEGQIRINLQDPFVGPITSVPDPSVFRYFYVDYLNITLVGSRLYAHSFFVVPAFFPPVSLRNAYATTSYEKDGTLLFLTDNTNYTLSGGRFTAKLFGDDLRGVPVSANTLYTIGPFADDNLVEATTPRQDVNSIIRVCLDEACTRIQETHDSFRPFNGTSLERVSASEITYTRIDTPEEWSDSLQSSYESFGIAPSFRLYSDTVLVPTESEWCKTDPACSVSPYQEPRASVKDGVIGGFVVGVFVLCVAVFWLLHLFLSRKQAKRNRMAFARRIADTVQVRGSTRMLSPNDLVKEFRMIDEANGHRNGRITKEELWDFVSTGKAGDMNRHDFDALFAAIDLDNDGDIDFLEFCAYMGKCHDEYRAVRKARNSSILERSRSVADSLSAYLHSNSDFDESVRIINKQEEHRPEEIPEEHHQA